MSILKKILLLVAATAVCLAVSLSGMGAWLLTSLAEFSAEQQLSISQQGVQREVNHVLQIQKSFAEFIERDSDLGRQVAEKDISEVRTFSQQMITAGGTIDTVIICDAQGRVLARGHSDKRDDILGPEQLSSHIPLTTGKRITGIEKSGDSSLALATGVPIRHEGKIVGAAVLGVDITSGNFVAGIKNSMMVDFTIFYGDTRVASSLTDSSGKSLVGTTLANKSILDTVLYKGGVYSAQNTIFGHDYNTFYWPWKDMAGNNAGMFFVGVSRDGIVATRQHAILVLSGAALAIMLAMLAGGYIMARAIAGPVKATTEYAQAVAQGDLERTFSVSSRDEVGLLAAALSSMVGSLKTKIAEAEQKSLEAEEQSQKAQEAMIEAKAAKEKAEAGQLAILQAAEQVEQVVNRLSAATEELSAQVEQSGKSTDVQRDRVAQSATAMEEMNSTVREVARNAGVASEGSETARQKASSGSEIVSRSMEALNRVEQSASTMSNEVHSLGRQAESIGQIMVVISDIADQTNLLALNAAIEAARAGEAGRGFAVVADEVRKLAEKTMTATKEVGDAISGIQQGTQRSIVSMQDAAKNVGDAAGLAQQSGKALEEIVVESEQVASQIQAIAAAAEEQSAASEEITRSLDEINSMAGENASAMQQSAQAVAELSQQAHELLTLVSNLRRKEAT